MDGGPTMEYPVSDKVATFDKKPLIEKGYYSGKLLEVKPRKKEGKHGTQIILMFAVHDKAGKNPVTVPKGENGTQDLFLPMVLNDQYRQKEDNTLRSAFTPNSRITDVFIALGWKFDATKTINPDDYVGNFLELNIDDVDTEWINEKNEKETYKSSQIKDVNKFEGEVTPSPSSQSKENYDAQQPKTVKKTLTQAEVDKKLAAKTIEENPNPGASIKVDKNMSNEEIEERLAKVKDLHEQGLLSAGGYEMAKESLEKYKK